MTRYRNTQPLPRELRGEPARGDTCHHGRALAGEGCPACGAEAGENIDTRTARRIAAVLSDPVAGVEAARGLRSERS